jgi:hypothetical protein
MNQLQLRYVEIVDFRRSELTNFADFAVMNPKIAHSLRRDDVVLFASATLRQLVFVYGFAVVEGERRVLASIRLRLEGASQWTEQLLRAYAKQAGLEIRGIPLLASALTAYHMQRSGKSQRVQPARRAA